MLAGCSVWNKHMYGYDKAVYVGGLRPEGPLWYSLSSKGYRGVLDQEWAYDLPSVRDHALILADAKYPDAETKIENNFAYIYMGNTWEKIACSADGVWLLFNAD